jgi:hypothetical protein
MNNFIGRLFGFIIVLLIIITMILNNWIHKELAVKPDAPPAVETTQESPPDTEETLERSSVSEIIFSNEITGLSIEEEAALRKAKQKTRELDQKIIYEMPTSNKILLQ